MTAHQKFLARREARKAFPVLTKCERCPNATWLERHHPDPLNEPLVIIVLCKRCHVAEHKRAGTYRAAPKTPVVEWWRVAEDIAGQIERGELQPGEKLPQGTILAGEYGVALPTARRAMKELRERGLIETLWGKGTFVKGPQ